MRRPRQSRDWWDRIFSHCPGAWYGTRPEPQGHIVVAPESVHTAVLYLGRQKRWLSIGVGPCRVMPDGGILIPVLAKTGQGGGGL